MAAATQSNNYVVEMDPYIRTDVQLSSMTSDQLESVVPADFLVATGLALPRPELSWELLTPPASRCPVSVSFESYSTTTAACGIRVFGGDLTDAVIILHFKSKAMKAGTREGA